MLKLKRVEIHGFKSFCDRTELRFRGDGIAAIVGPNGCGKSNLSDAISWVLGEQSAKSLRGTRMEDVIFAGTRDRKSLGMASVTMTLLDPAAHAPAAEQEQPVTISVLPVQENDHGNGANGNGVNGNGVHGNGTNGNGSNGNGTGGHGAQTRPKYIAAPTPAHVTPGEITITRRLFRSGESEYLINGRPARLRDIQDLFMGSGLGPESYAIIEQGRIGQILSARPYDRRSIIEEAAGISKFKARKRLAEAKLESAKQNLARVFDILEEVTRQANSLKRQAQRTKRYEELKTDLDGRLRTLLGARSLQLESEIARVSAELESAAGDLEKVSSATAQKDREREELQRSCYALEQALTAARAKLASVNVEAERTRGKLASQVRESAAIEDRMARSETEIQELETRFGALESERATLRETIEGLQHSISASRSLLVEKNSRREALQQDLRAREQTMEQSRVAVLRLLGEASTLKNQLAQIDEFLASIDRESGRAKREAEAAAAEVDRLAVARAKLSENLAQQQLELEVVTGERNRTESDLASHRRKSSELRQAIDLLGAECSRLRARKESIENVLAHHTYTTETVKKLLSAFERADSVQPAGVLADFIEVDSQYEKAAEEFLQQELEYVVVKTWDHAESGMRLLRENLEGRATFIVEKQTADASSAEPNPGLPRLADHLRFSNGLSAGAASLLPRLEDCYLAPSEERARTLAAEYPRLHFLLEDGRCYQGATLNGGRKRASGPLALKREVREVTAALAAKERELSAQTAAQENLAREIAQFEAELERLRHAQQSREKDAVALQAEQRKLSEEHHRAQSRISMARLELDRLQKELERSTAQREANRDAVARKEQERAEREQALEKARLELESMEAEAVRAREEHSLLRAELAGLEERFRAENNALQRLNSHYTEVSGRRRNLIEEMERMGETRARLLADNIELDRRSAELADETLRLEAEVAALANQEGEGRSQLAIADEELKALRGRIDAAHVRRSDADVALVGRQAEMKFLEETSRKELGLGLAEIERPAEPLEPEALAGLEAAHRDLASRLQALGPINPAAMEEFEHASQRQEFLTAQRKDLIDSIRDTEKAISEIDQVSKAKFLQAFEAVNIHFRECFTTLFGGGTGEMRLTDAENAGESGIDIVASPPGKKLQNVLLLSGGEKALAALALLMAIFRYQPSPFCVLDEVDAPLDEANIGRLTRLLREMSADTQFIVITHSKKTMESAEAMYGVTMQEAGVSKLVSVRFEARDREPVREPALA